MNEINTFGILLKKMEENFVSNLPGDYQFVKIFKELEKYKEIAWAEKILSVEYESIENKWAYWIVGKFKIIFIEHNNRHIRMYDVVLQYEYDGFDIPTKPTLVVSDITDQYKKELDEKINHYDGDFDI
ncbi:MAG: hypothetical protein ACLVIU_03460 [Paraclostridium sp.]|uniref:Uncharacterized protein n=1 Tax=Paeniclostridium hominis TaxID=2764329 RepID=A0ABR7K2P7_9FIRM|nr:MULTISPECIES: hypothetical protein [Paeniclostridium]MBC6003387.1 hypothetical protein [Paeniclostridium hominis]